MGNPCVGWSFERRSRAGPCGGLVEASESIQVGLGQGKMALQIFMLMKEALRFRPGEPNPRPFFFLLSILWCKSTGHKENGVLWQKDC